VKGVADHGALHLGPMDHEAAGNLEGGEGGLLAVGQAAQVQAERCEEGGRPAERVQEGRQVKPDMGLPGPPVPEGRRRPRPAGKA
jgi:hypothetical protein